MLKGYLLSKMDSDDKKIELNELWKKRITELREIFKEEDLEFFKSWLRSKYAQTIRPGKKGSANEDFEKIASRFHSWVRDNKNPYSIHVCFCSTQRNNTHTTYTHTRMCTCMIITIDCLHKSGKIQ